MILENVQMAVITNYGDSSTSGAGSFVQGTQATFILHFTDIDGWPYDPYEIDVYLLDPSNTVIETVEGITKIDTGEYAVDYAIDEDATPGTYTLRYTFKSSTTSGDTINTINEQFSIIKKTAEISIYANAQRRIMMGYLESLLRSTQNVPVKAEEVIWNNDRTIGKLTFNNWNQCAGIKVHRNNNLINTGFDVDYLRGEVAFDYALETTDFVDIDYCFRWFDDNNLSYYMDSGIQRVNYYPPVTNYTVGTTPQYWTYVAMWGAAVDAIRTLILDLIHQQPQIVLGGPDVAQKMIDVLDGQKKNYEEDLKTALDLKKYGSYHNLTNMTVTPEYTLPGGRCVSQNNRVFCLINESFQKVPVSRVYTFFENGDSIRVLSDKNGEAIFEPISKIWKSGKKDLLKIKTKTDDEIDVSKEHIIFANEIEIAAENLKIGDILEVFSNDKIIKSPIKEISHISPIETYDIEVPSTQNLFVNGIKCHNSRWFRYLFKG